MTLFLSTLVATYVLVAVVRRYAASWGLVATPNARDSHVAPTARGGGIGIVIAVLVAAAISVPATRANIVVAVSLLLVAVTSLIDDFRSLPALIRLAAQFGAAIAIVMACGAVHSFAGFPPGVFAIPITCVWIAGVTNAFNFMDGIDGIAGMQALVGALAWAIIGRMSGDRTLITLGIILAATSLGFLIHNWQPARIFMGDVASAFLGCVFATIPLLVPARASERFPLAVLILWPFLFDTTLTIIRRAHRRENIFRAHRSHLYQRLVIAGWSHARVALLYGALAAVGAAVAITRSTPLLALIPLLALGLWLYVLYLERKPISASSARIPSENEIGA